MRQENMQVRQYRRAYCGEKKFLCKGIYANATTHFYEAIYCGYTLLTAQATPSLRCGGDKVWQVVVSTCGWRSSKTT